MSDLKSRPPVPVRRRPHTIINPSSKPSHRSRPSLSNLFSSSSQKRASQLPPTPPPPRSYSTTTSSTLPLSLSSSKPSKPVQGPSFVTAECPDNSTSQKLLISALANSQAHPPPASSLPPIPSKAPSRISSQTARKLNLLTPSQIQMLLLSTGSQLSLTDSSSTPQDKSAENNDISSAPSSMPLQCNPPAPKLLRDQYGRYFYYFPNIKVIHDEEASSATQETSADQFHPQKSNSNSDLLLPDAFTLQSAPSSATAKSASSSTSSLPMTAAARKKAHRRVSVLSQTSEKRYSTTSIKSSTKTVSVSKSKNSTKRKSIIYTHTYTQQVEESVVDEEHSDSDYDNNEYSDMEHDVQHHLNPTEYLRSMKPPHELMHSNSASISVEDTYKHQQNHKASISPQNPFDSRPSSQASSSSSSSSNSFPNQKSSSFSSSFPVIAKSLIPPPPSLPPHRAAHRQGFAQQMSESGIAQINTRRNLAANTTSSSSFLSTTSSSSSKAYKESASYIPVSRPYSRPMSRGSRASTASTESRKRHRAIRYSMLNKDLPPLPPEAYLDEQFKQDAAAAAAALNGDSDHHGLPPRSHSASGNYSGSSSFPGFFPPTGPVYAGSNVSEELASASVAPAFVPQRAPSRRLYQQQQRPYSSRLYSTASIEESEEEALYESNLKYSHPAGYNRGKQLYRRESLLRRHQDDTFKSNNNPQLINSRSLRNNSMQSLLSSSSSSSLAYNTQTHSISRSSLLSEEAGEFSSASSHSIQNLHQTDSSTVGRRGTRSAAGINRKSSIRSCRSIVSGRSSTGGGIPGSGLHAQVSHESLVKNYNRSLRSDSLDSNSSSYKSGLSPSTAFFTPHSSISTLPGSNRHFSSQTLTSLDSRYYSVDFHNSLDSFSTPQNNNHSQASVTSTTSSLSSPNKLTSSSGTYHYPSATSAYRPSRRAPVPPRKSITSGVTSEEPSTALVTPHLGHHQVTTSNPFSPEREPIETDTEEAADTVERLSPVTNSINKKRSLLYNNTTNPSGQIYVQTTSSAQSQQSEMFLDNFLPKSLRSSSSASKSQAVYSQHTSNGNTTTHRLFKSSAAEYQQEVSLAPKPKLFDASSPDRKPRIEMIEETPQVESPTASPSNSPAGLGVFVGASSSPSGSTSSSPAYAAAAAAAGGVGSSASASSSPTSAPETPSTVTPRSSRFSQNFSLRRRSSSQDPAETGGHRSSEVLAMFNGLLCHRQPRGHSIVGDVVDADPKPIGESCAATTGNATSATTNFVPLPFQNENSASEKFAEIPKDKVLLAPPITFDGETLGSNKRETFKKGKVTKVSQALENTSLDRDLNFTQDSLAVQQRQQQQLIKEVRFSKNHDVISNDFEYNAVNNSLGEPRRDLLKPKVSRHHSFPSTSSSYYSDDEEKDEPIVSNSLRSAPSDPFALVSLMAAPTVSNSNFSKTPSSSSSSSSSPSSSNLTPPSSISSADSPTLDLIKPTKDLIISSDETCATVPQPPPRRRRDIATTTWACDYLVSSSSMSSSRSSASSATITATCSSHNSRFSSSSSNKSFSHEVHSAEASGATSTMAGIPVIPPRSANRALHENRIKSVVCQSRSSQSSMTLASRRPQAMSMSVSNPFSTSIGKGYLEKLDQIYSGMPEPLFAPVPTAAASVGTSVSPLHIIKKHKSCTAIGHSKKADTTQAPPVPYVTRATIEALESSDSVQPKIPPRSRSYVAAPCNYVSSSCDETTDSEDGRQSACASYDASSDKEMKSDSQSAVSLTLTSPPSSPPKNFGDQPRSAVMDSKSTGTASTAPPALSAAGSATSCYTQQQSLSSCDSIAATHDLRPLAAYGVDRNGYFADVEEEEEEKPERNEENQYMRATNRSSNAQKNAAPLGIIYPEHSLAHQHNGFGFYTNTGAVDSASPLNFPTPSSSSSSPSSSYSPNLSESMYPTSYKQQRRQIPSADTLATSNRLSTQSMDEVIKTFISEDLARLDSLGNNIEPLTIDQSYFTHHHKHQDHQPKESAPSTPQTPTFSFFPFKSSSASHTPRSTASRPTSQATWSSNTPNQADKERRSSTPLSFVFGKRRSRDNLRSSQVGIDGHSPSDTEEISFNGTYHSSASDNDTTLNTISSTALHSTMSEQMQVSKYADGLGPHISGTSPLLETAGFIRHVDSDGMDESDNEDDDTTRNNISLDKDCSLRATRSATLLKTFSPEQVSANSTTAYNPESNYPSTYLHGSQNESPDSQHSVKKRMSVASRLRMFGRKKSTVGLV